MTSPTAANGPPIPAGQIGAGARGFTHSGRDYLLGWGDDFIGIWERKEAEGPVHRFNRNPEGWELALKEASSLDPSLVQVEPVWHAVPELRPIPRPQMRTVLALALVVIAIAMTTPASVQALSAPCLPPPEELGISDWADSLWNLSAVVGISSLVFALYRLQAERRRNSRWGQILAGSAFGVAILGGLFGALPLLCGANAGL